MPRDIETRKSQPVTVSLKSPCLAGSSTPEPPPRHDPHWPGAHCRPWSLCPSCGQSLHLNIQVSCQAHTDASQVIKGSQLMLWKRGQVLYSLIQGKHVGEHMHGMGTTTCPVGLQPAFLLTSSLVRLYQYSATSQPAVLFSLENIKSRYPPRQRASPPQTWWLLQNFLTLTWVLVALVGKGVGQLFPSFPFPGYGAPSMEGCVYSLCSGLGKHRGEGAERFSWLPSQCSSLSL